MVRARWRVVSLLSTAPRLLFFYAMRRALAAPLCTARVRREEALARVLALCLLQRQLCCEPSADTDPNAQQTERRPGDFELLADRRVRLRRRRVDRAARLARPAARRRLRLSRRHRAAAVRHQESRIDPAVFPAGGAPAARARREMSRRRVQHRVGHRARCAHARIRPGAGHRRARAGRCGRVPGDACRSHRGARDGEHGARGRLPGGDHCAGGPTPSSLRAPVPCSSRWRKRAGRTARSSRA